ncbi:MAG: hypothetical protein H7Z21_00215, partial [Hymenobacter sp.]|nr:hypothetical protein [Hymenobacter sp.]
MKFPAQARKAFRGRVPGCCLVLIFAAVPPGETLGAPLRIPRQPEAATAAAALTPQQ